MAKKMTGKELVAFCRSKIGTPYVYGMKGKVMTEQNYKFLKNTYGKMVWLSDRDKIGKVCVDCSGLISWACGVTVEGKGNQNQPHFHHRKGTHRSVGLDAGAYRGIHRDAKWTPVLCGGGWIGIRRARGSPAV